MRKPGKVKCACFNCGSVTERYRCHIVRSKNVFCNQKCYIEFKSAGSIQRPCLACGKIICVHKSRLESGSGIYCSIACRDSGVKRSKFVCVSCGNEFELTESQYRNTKSIGRGKYCSNRCKHIGSRGENSPSWAGGKIARSFYVYQMNAAKKGHEFKLTFTEFVNLKSGRCHYCGSVSDIGVDRIDSSKGYFSHNTVSCCRTCNQMKWNRTTCDFIGHIRKILDFYREGMQNVL